MKKYGVYLPIGGTAYVAVEAENEGEAIDKAIDEVTIDHIEDWEAMKKVNSGNVCHFPGAWEAEATEI